jgi:hypothetical protein
MSAQTSVSCRGQITTSVFVDRLHRHAFKIQIEDYHLRSSYPDTQDFWAINKQSSSTSQLFGQPKTGWNIVKLSKIELEIFSSFSNFQSTKNLDPKATHLTFPSHVHQSLLSSLIYIICFYLHQHTFLTSTFKMSSMMIINVNISIVRNQYEEYMHQQMSLNWTFWLII